MKLMLFSREFPPGPGGMGTHAYQLCVHLNRMGWEVMVLTLQDHASEEEIQEFNRSQPFQIVRLLSISSRMPKLFNRWRQASSWVKKFKPDLLMASGDRAVWLGFLVASMHRLPWIAVGHGVEFGTIGSWINRQRRKLTRWCFSRATAVICVSKFTWDAMIASGTHPKTGRVILNGADPLEFFVLSEIERKHFLQELGLDGNLLLLTVGKVWERKGQDIVIRALPKILEKIPNVFYLIVGLPRKRQHFEKLAETLGVADHLRFCGQVPADQLNRFFNCCDVFVMTSRQAANGDFEGFGIAVVEAALCGKPSVVSLNSGLAEAMIDGQTGIGVPQGDEQSVIAAITTLLENEDLRKKMGRTARETALKNQTWEHQVKQYDEFLRDVLKVSAPLQAEQLHDHRGKAAS
jgi:phosphatidyl-myo-inositol dimannoside synthase